MSCLNKDNKNIRFFVIYTLRVNIFEVSVYMVKTFM